MYIPGSPFPLRLKLQRTVVASTGYYTSLNCWEVGRRIHQTAPACYEVLPQRSQRGSCRPTLLGKSKPDFKQQRMSTCPRCSCNVMNLAPRPASCSLAPTRREQVCAFFSRPFSLSLQFCFNALTIMYLCSYQHENLANMFAWLDWNQVANKCLGDCIAVMIGLFLAFLLWRFGPDGLWLRLGRALERRIVGAMVRQAVREVEREMEREREEMRQVLVLLHREL